jgi:hypothetical protein
VARSNAAAVAAAKARREVRFKWNTAAVCGKVSLTLEQRVRIVVEHLKTRITRNISVPVVKERSKITGRIIVTERSSPGEFPRADTTNLMKTLMTDVVEIEPGNWVGYVGTPTMYGLILELGMHREFLTRTMNEEYETVMGILGGPVQ